MKHDFLDHHRAGDSPVHKADPRLKVIMMVLYILVVVAIPYSAKHYFMYLTVIPVVLALASGVSFFHFLSKLSKIYPMIFLITFLLPFFPGGNGVGYHWGFLKIYEPGLQKFLMINIKSILAMFMSIVLTTTTDFSMLLKGMEKLKVPRVMIIILSFMYRFIFLLIDETERMLMAFQSRYIRLPVFTRLKMLARQIGVLFIRTYERGERVYQAMDARGFSGEIYTIGELEWKFSDSMVLAVFLIFLCIPFLV
ncbi:MAG: cobalt ECF transporter T component CbiQ [Calditrichia bacterium]